MDKKTEEFYIRLREELNNTSKWPSEYLYKFIVPTSPKKIEEVENAFDNIGAVIHTKQSKKRKIYQCFNKCDDGKSRTCC